MAKNSGFSYLELMFVLMIMGILSVAGMTSYSSFQARTQTEAEMRSIDSYIEIAREKTSSGDKTGACGTYGGFYSVVLAGSALTLVPNGCPAVATHTVRTGYTLPEGDFQLDFQPFGTGFTGPTCIIVEHPKSTFCGKITVEGSGVTKTELLNECTC